MIESVEFEEGLVIGSPFHAIGWVPRYKQPVKRTYLSKLDGDLLYQFPYRKNSLTPVPNGTSILVAKIDATGEKDG